MTGHPDPLECLSEMEAQCARVDQYRAHEARLAAGTASNKFKSEQKRTTGFGGADCDLSRRVTAAKKIELAALRELTRACTKFRGGLRQADDADEIIDVKLIRNSTRRFPDGGF